jgi:hypothetical protein
MIKPNTGKYFPTYFSLYYQISKNTFSEFTFFRIHFLKKIIFQQTNRVRALLPPHAALKGSLHQNYSNYTKKKPQNPYPTRAGSETGVPF